MFILFTGIPRRVGVSQHVQCIVALTPSVTPLRLITFGEIWSSKPCVLQAQLRPAGYTLGFATHF